MILHVRLKPGATIEQVIYLLGEIASYAGENSTIQLQGEQMQVSLGSAHFTSDEREQGETLRVLGGRSPGARYLGSEADRTGERASIRQ